MLKSKWNKSYQRTLKFAVQTMGIILKEICTREWLTNRKDIKQYTTKY